MTVDDAVQVPIDSDEHIIDARAQGRALATRLGFSRTDATLIATAISEIARNILVHAGSGEVAMRPEIGDRRCGLVVVASDSGPGIRDVDAAMQEGYGTKGGMAKWRESDGVERLNGNG